MKWNLNALFITDCFVIIFMDSTVLYFCTTDYLIQFFENTNFFSKRNISEMWKVQWMHISKKMLVCYLEKGCELLYLLLKTIKILCDFGLWKFVFGRLVCKNDDTDGKKPGSFRSTFAVRGGHRVYFTSPPPFSSCTATIQQLTSPPPLNHTVLDVLRISLKQSKHLPWQQH